MLKDAAIWILLILLALVLMISAYEGSTGACLAALVAPNLLSRDDSPTDIFTTLFPGIFGGASAAATA